METVSGGAQAALWLTAPTPLHYQPSSQHINRPENGNGRATKVKNVNEANSDALKLKRRAINLKRHPLKLSNIFVRRITRDLRGSILQSAPTREKALQTF
jgi:hypothetical protein